MGSTKRTLKMPSNRGSSSFTRSLVLHFTVRRRFRPLVCDFFIEQITLPSDASAGIVLLFLLTLLLTNFMTNVSAVAIAFPIAAAMMQHYELGHLEVFLPVAFGASGSFLTPSSYQTHLMIMGPGNYSNKDFLKLGLPVLLVYSAVALWVLL